MSNIVHSQDGEKSSPAVLQHVSINLRTLRKERRVSQGQLAEAAGLSRRMIAAIENGAANVSLGTVDRLAAALDVTFTRLVRDPAADDYSRMEVVGWKGRQPSSRAVLLGAAPGQRETELWLWSLAPGESFNSEEIADSWHEMLLVLSGELSLVRNSGTEVLKPRAFRIFNSREPYRFCNNGTTKLIYVRILVL